MVAELLTYLGAWICIGAVCAAGYWATWRGRFSYRHVLAWPIVMGCLFWGVTLPEWLRPSHRQIRYERMRSGEGIPAEEVLAVEREIREQMRRQGLD